MICEDRIEQAKQAVIQERKLSWRRNWILHNQGDFESDAEVFARVPDPPEDLAPETWFVRIWDTGCLVMDAELYSKIPAAKRRKFEKLTHIYR